MGHESIESMEYINREFPEGCAARDIQFLTGWLTDAFHAGYSAALKSIERSPDTNGTKVPYGSPTRAHEIALPGTAADATAPNKSQPNTISPKYSDCARFNWHECAELKCSDICYLKPD
jgi:hypothetical protein